MFARLQEQLHRQKEEEREALAVAEEASAADRETGTGTGTGTETETETRDDALNSLFLQRAAEVGIRTPKSVPSQAEPEDVAKLREAVLRKSQEQRERFATAKRAHKDGERERDRRLHQQDTRRMPPVPFMHERASQEKMEREDAQRGSVAHQNNHMYGDKSAANIGAAVLDPLYGPW